MGRFDRIVQCSEGHLFVTTWIPGVSFKAVRWFGRRFQPCPVGGHMSWVEPVPPDSLTEEVIAAALANRDTRIP